MSIVLGRGQCGAHITLLFTIDDSSEDPVYQGSRGAGICLKDGVEAIAKGEKGSGEIIVKFKNREYDSSMYQDVLSELVKEIPEIGDFDWELDIIMSLPTSQGFGMSASGAVASSMAIQRAIGIPHEECVRRSFLVAHIVERKRSSGLGDTTALSSGGVERRISAGSPFSGSLLDNGPGVSQGWSVEIPVLILWKEKTGRHTSSYIDSEEWRRKICLAGEHAMERIGEGEWKEQRWSELIEESLRFASDSGLEVDASRSEIIESVKKAIDNSEFSGSLSAMLCMLGESVVIVPKDPHGQEDWIYKISKELEGYGLSSFSSRVGELR
mgnify:CR=1 FL=1